MNDDKILKPEDYEEPSCPLCMSDGSVNPINTRRFIEKLDEYYGKNDYDGALRHLKYWLDEAVSGNDLRGQFSVYNEMMGYYRKTGQRNAALDAAEKALDLIGATGIYGTASTGTAYVNVATVYKTFNESDKALPWFEKARSVYESTLDGKDSRLGGLYNNMALSLSDLHQFDRAIEYYEKALSVMADALNGELEMAITYLNMANAREAELGLQGAEEYITEYLDRAWELLQTGSLTRNGYYAFVCDKCAPTFEYYGYFLYAAQLKETAGRIYERA